MLNRRGRCHAALLAEVQSVTVGSRSLENTKTAMVVLAEDEPTNYSEATKSKNAENGRKHAKMNIKYSEDNAPGILLNDHQI